MSESLSGKISRWHRIQEFAERRLPALTRLRASEALPIHLHRRRIYVLPTAFGIGFTALLGVMLLGALNYANNPALLLTCILGAAAWMSLFAGFRTLAGLELIAIQAAECHAGDALELHCSFAGTRDRPSLRLRWMEVIQHFSLRGMGPQTVIVSLPTRHRGWLRPGRLKLWTEQPLGLFILWSWLNPVVEALVYPALEHPAPPLPLGQGQEGARQILGDGQEYSGLRGYRSGDPQRRIAWKASARHDDLLVRETEYPQGELLVFDYRALAALDGEARIRRLAAWVIAAEAAQLGYALHLPGQQIPVGLGDAHRHTCLRALALMPHAPE